jgi:hypothetical protein
LAKKQMPGFENGNPDIIAIREEIEEHSETSYN